MSTRTSSSSDTRAEQFKNASSAPNHTATQKDAEQHSSENEDQYLVTFDADDPKNPMVREYSLTEIHFAQYSPAELVKSKKVVSHKFWRPARPQRVSCSHSVDSVLI